MNNVYEMKRLDEIQREIEENREELLKVRERVEEILQNDFDGLYDYFLSAIEKNYTYIILMSRRCMVLFQLFLFFIVLDETEIEIKSIILSDKAIPWYRKKIKSEDTVLIIDDVIVHGRALSMLHSLLEHQCKIENSEIWGYVSSEDLECFPERLRKRLTVFYEASRKEWRNLSNRLVSSIFAANVPYTSFVTAFYQYGDSTWLDKLFENTNWKMYPMTNVSQKEENLQAEMYFENSWDRPGLFKSLSIDECIRVYKNPTINKVTVIPYVFVRNMGKEDLQNIFTTIGILLPEKYCCLKNVFLSGENAFENPVNEYKMRVLTCILSNIYWKSVKQRYQIDSTELNILYTDKDTLELSFGSEITEEISSISLSEIEKILNYQPTVFCNTEEDEQLKQVLEKHVNESETWKDGYFYEAWSIDEDLAKQCKKRKQGLSIECFIEKCKAVTDDIREILKELVGKWDSGVAAANYVIASEGSFVGCMITSGEQSYRIILERNPFPMYALIFISEFITKGDAKRENKKYEEYRVRKLEQFLDLIKSEYKIEEIDYQKIKELINENQGYLNDWNQFGHLKNPMEYSKEDQKLIKEFITQEIKDRRTDE